MSREASARRQFVFGALPAVTSGVVAAVTGFASSFALVIAGLQAVGATPGQAASGLLALCLGQGLLMIVLSLRYRMPLSFAWSTPGAAVLVAAEASGDGSDAAYPTAVGAFLVCAVLLIATGLWPWLARAMTSIPAPIASAMLAGILFPICLAPVTAAVELPIVAVPMIVVWLLLTRFAPRWAVPAAVIVAGAGIALTAGSGWAEGAVVAPRLEFVVPAFDPIVAVSLGVPLYIVTMAGQNVPGFAVLSTFGYTDPPARVMLASTGFASAITAPFGGYTLNLAAITAAMTAGPDAHPDPARRWIGTVAGGTAYLVIGLGAALATALVTASPPVLVTAVAGLALLGALVTSVTTALADPNARLVAIGTFLVVASGVVIAGIGSAFWGLLVGGVLLLVLRRRR